MFGFEDQDVFTPYALTAGGKNISEYIQLNSPVGNTKADGKENGGEKICHWC